MNWQEKRESATAIVDEIREQIGESSDHLPDVQRIRQSGPFESHRQFIKSSMTSLYEMLRLTDITPESSVLDYGCGLGRMCLPMKTYLSADGRYHGIDTDNDAVRYLLELYTDERFSFEHIDAFSQMYNPAGAPLTDALNALAQAAPVDLAFLFSVFTHVLPHDMEPLLTFLKLSLIHI